LPQASSTWTGSAAARAEVALAAGAALDALAAEDVPELRAEVEAGAAVVEVAAATADGAGATVAAAGAVVALPQAASAPAPSSPTAVVNESSTERRGTRRASCSARRARYLVPAAELGWDVIEVLLLSTHVQGGFDRDASPSP